MASTCLRRNALRSILPYRICRIPIAQPFSTTIRTRNDEDNSNSVQDPTEAAETSSPKDEATDHLAGELREHHKTIAYQYKDISPQSPWEELAEVYGASGNLLAKRMIPEAPDEKQIDGYLVTKRVLSAKLGFGVVSLETGGHRDVRLVFTGEELVSQLKQTRLHSPVQVVGVWKVAQAPQGRQPKEDSTLAKEEKELHVKTLGCYNQVPNRPMSDLDNFPPNERVLQLRFHRELGHRLKFRCDLQGKLSHYANALGYTRITTPTLFKSTPEGAREFLVPSRTRGSAYALVQSPQQYKQALMAAGFHGYQQFATCWRNEDLRQDRQPEFMQLDLEKSFKTGVYIRKEVNLILRKAFGHIQSNYQLARLDGHAKSYVPLPRPPGGAPKGIVPPSSNSSYYYNQVPRAIPALRYDTALEYFGSDKPDLRIPCRIHDVTALVSEDFKRMITKLDDPIIDAWSFRLKSEPGPARQWINSFMDQLDKKFIENPDGAPVILVSDPEKPLDNFSSLGPEGIKPIYQLLFSRRGTNEFEAGMSAAQDESTESPDQECNYSVTRPSFIVVLQARRRPDSKIRYRGTSTRMGELRKLIFEHAIANEHRPAPDPSYFRLCWVTDFPMFKPEEKDGDPGQGGSAGITAVHHPFTAPLSKQDFELLETEPLRAVADSYDLVLNGVEVGGGSRRIHRAEIQEAIMRRVLKMSDERVEQFRPLLNALQYAPPHAGFALGFDRLVALLSGTSSIRDVIAFPKTMKGEDAWAQSPAPMTEEQLETYHLRLREEVD